MPFQATISAPDIDKQIALFGNQNKIIERFTRSAMADSTKLMLAGWRDVAAVETEKYKNTLKMEVKSIASGRILQGSIRSFARSDRGFPYPRALENSTIYHYRATKRRGQRTAGKLARAFLSTIPLVNKNFARASVKIVNALAVK